MSYQTLMTALAAATMLAGTASAQVAANPYGSAQEEAKAVQSFQQSVKYPMAKTYSSREEALGATDRPTISDYQGGSVEIFTQPLPQSSMTIPAQSRATPYMSPVITRTAVKTDEGRTVYTVMSGDTLYGIGRRYGLKPSALMNANGLSGTAISPGQVLIIPTGQTQIVRTSPQAPANIDGGQVAVVRNVSPIPADNVYAVLPGDTLYSISGRSCVTPEALAAASGISVDSTLQPGQRLTLPQGFCN